MTKIPNDAVQLKFVGYPMWRVSYELESGGQLGTLAVGTMSLQR